MAADTPTAATAATGATTAAAVGPELGPAPRNARRAIGEVRTAARWSLQHGLPRLLVARAARGGDPQARLILDPGVRADPYPALEAIRARGDLVPGRLAFITCTHAVARDVLRSEDMTVGVDPHALPRGLREINAWARDPLAYGPLDPPSLLAVEPPDHTRYRTLVSKVFTARAVERLRSRTEEIATGLLDRMAAQGPVLDLIPAYATLLPVTVIAEILGVPEPDLPRVLRFGAGAAPSLDLGLTFGQYRSVQRSLREFNGWLDQHLANLRREPGDDLLSQLVTVREDGRGLTHTELRSTAGLVLAAGFETTVNLLGSGTQLLMRHPDQLAALRADPQLWPNAVDEILRFESPVQVTARTALRDTNFAGVAVRAGQLVATQLAGANRDPAVFEEPGKFDVARPNARDHLAFSGGRHFCLGAALARMEGDVGLRLLFERFPDLAAEPGAARRGTRVLRGWSVLPVRLTPPTDGAAPDHRAADHRAPDRRAADHRVTDHRAPDHRAVPDPRAVPDQHVPD